ncbi:hypothetical protein KSD_00400 [Ktedonobacter sp. SOSP1-85]|nr:hypothetical protein KSD_00400 [Ktedonobacter sp. SOSP1-85]
MEEEHGQRVSTATMSRAIRDVGWTRKRVYFLVSVKDKSTNAALQKEEKTVIDKGQHIQAIAITAFGGPDQLKLVDLPVPPCGPEQVLISVQAAGVGMWDVKVR